MKKIFILLAFLCSFGFSQRLVWDGNNPFYQPSNTTLYWGSGDANGDGLVNQTDVNVTQQMINNSIEKSMRSDVNGDGIIDTYDINLIQNAVNGSYLPGWWNNLTTRSQRESWFNCMLKFDYTRNHPYGLFFQCGHFSSQFFINFSYFREDLSTTIFNGGQTKFNIPSYKVTGNGHEFNAVLVGDNPLKGSDWVFIEPQENRVIRLGDFQLSNNTTINITTPNQISNNGNLPNNKVTFNIQADTFQYVDNSNILITRPFIPSNLINNTIDYWNPIIVPNSQNKIIVEGINEFINYHNTSLYLTNFPITDPISTTPINYCSKSERILDTKKDNSGNLWLLFKDADTYSGCLKAAILDTTNNNFINNIYKIKDSTLSLVGGKIIQSQSQLHAFWSEKHYSDEFTDIYWSTFNGTSWGVPIKIVTTSVLVKFFYENHDWSNYNFDVTLLPNNNILLCFINQYNNVYWNFDMSYLIYDFNTSTWSTPILIESNNIRGLQLTTNNNVTHLLYWLGQQSVGIGCERGNLLYRNYQTSWSNSIIVDSSNAASCVRITNIGTKIGAVWEKYITKTVPILGILENGNWIKKQLPCDTNTSTWYPNLKLLPSNHLAVVWSERTDSIIKIQTYDTILTCINISIMSQPNNTTVMVGNTANFSISVNGASPTYQWQVSTNGGSTYFNVSSGTGITTSNYTTPPTTSDMNGYKYRCKVYNSCPSFAYSTNANLTVNGCTNVSIMTQPSNTTAISGNTANFSISANGASPSYQWQQSTNNGTSFTNISGATSANYTTVATTTAMNSYKYRCVVSNPCPSSVTSTAATLTVTGIPTVIIVGNTANGTSTDGMGTYFCAIQITPITDMIAKTISIQCPASSASFKAAIYTNNSGAPGTVLRETSIKVGQTAGWNVLTLTSDLTLTANTSYWIGAISNNSGFTMYQTAGGNTPYAAWSSFPVMPTNPSVSPWAYTYCFYVSGTSVGSCTSVGIGSQPANSTVASGTTASFSVTATGTAPSYQWQQSTNGGTSFTNINGATSASYTTAVTTTAMNAYQYRCAVSNTCPSSVNSAVAILTVTAPGSETFVRGIDLNGTVNRTIDGNVWDYGQNNFTCTNYSWTGTATLSPAVSGDKDAMIKSVKWNQGTATAVIFNVTNGSYNVYAYTWEDNGGACVGKINVNNVDQPNYTLNSNNTWQRLGPYPVTISNNTITVKAIKVSGSLDPMISGIEIYNTGSTTCTNVTVTSQPVNKTVMIGLTTSFSIITSGTSPTFQWQVSTDGGYNFNDISGAKSTNYNTPPTTSDMNGYKYRCNVSNSCPSFITSNNAVLTVF